MQLKIAFVPWDCDRLILILYASNHQITKIIAIKGHFLPSLSNKKPSAADRDGFLSADALTDQDSTNQTDAKSEQ